jgi:peptide/nickel transport system ATP-binding protein
MSAPLLAVSGLTRHFPLKGGLFGHSTGTVRAVDDISFDVAEGETLGIVGESGCGKSTTARLLVDLITPDSGTIRLGGKLVGAELTIRDLRRHVQMVFQDSYASLNPRLTMEDAISFGPKVNGMATGKAISLARDLLARVGLDPARFAGRYPHELSGGQRQRVNIARALAQDRRAGRSRIGTGQIRRGAGAQPVGRPQGRAWAHLHLHLP